MTVNTSDDAAEKQDVKLLLAHKKFLLKTPGIVGVSKDQLQSEILELLYKDGMAPLYESFCTELGWAVDGMKLEQMQSDNAAKLKELEDKIKDAEENLGETEVRDSLHAKADFLAKIGDKAAAITAYQETEKKTAGGGNKVDLIFSQLRLNIVYWDWHAVKANIAAAKQLCEAGGDWERKNKLKVYEGLFAMYVRDFKRAADLFLDSTATFTTYELFPYHRCIFYAVLTSMVSLDRVTLKKRVVDAPEVLTVIDQIPHLGSFLTSLYNCKYGEFFKALVEVVDQMRADMYMYPHLRWYQREIRVVVYSQFLESYKSVTVESMASAFNVSPAFLDGEISEFIVAGRLNAKIDKVAGIIESKRPDLKNAQYADAIRKGDVLLNRVQKLSKVVDLD